MRQSEWQSPAPATSMRTWPGPGSGTVTSVTTSPPVSCTRTAFIDRYITCVRMDIGSGYRARMSSFSERAGVSDVAGLIDRSTELFPGVAPSTGALWLLATRAGRMTEAFTREVLAD